MPACDAAHDQPGGDLLTLAAAGERGVVDLGDLGVGDPPLLGFLPDRVGILDRGPRLLVDGGDRGLHRPVLPGGDRETGPGTARVGHHGMGEKRRVTARHDESAVVPGAGALGYVHTAGHEPGRTAGRIGRPLAQQGAADERRSGGGGDRAEQRVQSLDPVVAIPGTLLGVAVGAFHGVVDVDEADLIGPGQQRGVPGQACQQPPRYRRQLQHVPEGEGPQERSAGGGGTDSAEEAVHAPMAQQVHVVDAVGPGDHPRHQRADLHRGVAPARLGQCHMLTDQLGQTGPISQRHHRHQAHGRHQIILIEPAGNRARSVGELHLADVLPVQRNGAFDSTIIAVQEGICSLRRSPGHTRRRWIQAQIASSQQSIIGLATRANLTPVFETLDATLCRYNGVNTIIGDFAKQMGWAPLLRGYSAPPGFRYDNYLNRLPGRPSARRVALVHHSGDLQSSLVGVEALTAPDLDDGDESELGQELAATVVEPWRSAPSKVRDALLRRLRSLDSEVPGFIVGGWTEIDRPGPVASSVIAHCAAEIVSRTLRALAPDPEVVAWVAAHLPRQQGLLTDRGDPTRQARVRYAVRDRPGRDRRLVEAQIVALSKLMGETYGVQQPVKHENPVAIHTAELYLMSAEAAVAMLLSQTD